MAAISEGSQQQGRLKEVPIVLLGCGGVGQQLINHILNARSLHAAQGLHISVAAVCDSKSIVMGKGKHGIELADEVLKRITKVKASGCPLSTLLPHELEGNMMKGGVTKEDIYCIFEQSIGTRGLVVVDCTASEETSKLLSQAAVMGLCIVLANKKPLTSTLEVHDTLFKKCRQLRFESTVGAGLPIITAVTRFLNAGDPVFRIVGALSGTLGYVMSSLQQRNSFSSVVQVAKSLGYTEPDPRDDLSGIDVARKALILARLMGWRINMSDIEIESLFPVEMESGNMSVDQFLAEGLCTLDAKMNERVLLAQSRDCVLRYVATIENFRCKVGIVEVSNDSSLGQLKGSDNLVEVYTRCYKKSPFVIQGAGAGNDTTASGVLADIVDLQDIF